MNLNTLYRCAHEYTFALYALKREEKFFEEPYNMFEALAEETLYHSITSMMYDILREYCGEYSPNYKEFKKLFSGLVLNKDITITGEIDKKEYTISNYRDIIDYFAAQKKTYDILFPEEN